MFYGRAVDIAMHHLSATSQCQIGPLNPALLLVLVLVFSRLNTLLIPRKGTLTNRSAKPQLNLGLKSSRSRLEKHCRLSALAPEASKGSALSVTECGDDLIFTNQPRILTGEGVIPERSRLIGFSAQK